MAFKSKSWAHYDDRDEPYGGPDQERMTLDEALSSFAEVMIQAGSSVSQALKRVFGEAGIDPQLEGTPLSGHQWHGHRYPPPHISRYHSDHLHVSFDAIKEIMEPVIEVTQGHWAVCKHKPRCKKPPEYVKFNKHEGQSRPERGRWIQARNFHR